MNIKFKICIVFIVSILFMLSNSAFSKAKSASGMDPYNEKTLKTIKGEIVSIDTVFNRHTQENGLHLSIESSSVKYIIHVCPEWYAEKNKIQFKKNEKISVTGSEFEKDNEKNIYAASIVRSSGAVLKLRDKNTGKTLWKGRYEGTKKGKGKGKGRRRR